MPGGTIHSAHRGHGGYMKNKMPVVSGILAVILLLSSGFNFYHIQKNIKKQKSVSFYAQQSPGDISREEYVWIATMVDYSMFVNHDERALKQFARDMGVKVTIEGPPTYDIPGTAATIEKVIKRKPAGIMVMGTERSLIPYVNKAVEAGIPTITVDADLVESKRLAFVGSNWYNIGKKQGQAMAELIGGKGKVAMMGIGGADNMEQGFEGFKSVMKDYPDIIIIDEYDDMANLQEAQRITEELLKAHPDIAGIAGFDSYSGPGIGAAVKEANLAGKVKVTAVDIEPEHLKLVKEGVIQKLVGQKRELFTYYGARLLYDINHLTITLTEDDAKNGITPIPYIVDTGLIEVDPSNVNSIADELNKSY